MTSTHTLHHLKYVHHYKQRTEVSQFTGFLPNEATTYAVISSPHNSNICRENFYDLLKTKNREGFVPHKIYCIWNYIANNIYINVVSHTLPEGYYHAYIDQY